MKVIPRDISVTISDKGGSAVIVDVTDASGEHTILFIDPDSADDLGRTLLAGAFALNGRLS